MRRSVTALIGLALALRVAVVLLTPAYHPGSDAADYDRHGVSIAATNGYPQTSFAFGGATAFRSPLYPAALAAVYRLSGPGEARWDAARLAQAVGGAALAGLIGLLALRLYGDRRVAVAAVGLAAVYPPLLSWGSTLVSEPLFVGLEVLGVLAVLRARSSLRHFRWAMAAGLLAGLAALARPNGILLLLPFAVGVWVRRPRFSWRSVAAPALAIAVAIAIVLPWTIRNARAFDAFVPLHTNSGWALHGTYNDTVRTAVSPYPALWRTYVPEYQAIVIGSRDEAEMDRRLLDASLRDARQHPAYVAKVALWNAARLFDGHGLAFERIVTGAMGIPSALSDAAHYGFLVVALLAAGGLLVRRGRTLPAFVWLLIGLLWISTVVVLGYSRYRQPFEPFLVCAAAVAAVSLWDRAPRRRSSSESVA